jgi:hypothetical protein
MGDTLEEHRCALSNMRQGFIPVIKKRVIKERVVSFRLYETCRMGVYLLHQVRGVGNVTDCDIQVNPFDTRMRRIWHKCGQCTIQQGFPNTMRLTGVGIRMIFGLPFRGVQDYRAP